MTDLRFEVTKLNCGGCAGRDCWCCRSHSQPRILRSMRSVLVRLTPRAAEPSRRESISRPWSARRAAASSRASSGGRRW